MKKTNLRKKIVSLLAVCALVVSSIIVTDIEKEHNVNNDDGHDWEWHDAYKVEEGFACDAEGNVIDHWYCLICGEDLTLDIEQKIWYSKNCGKSADYWSYQEELKGLVGTAVLWHDMYYGRDCVNKGMRPYKVSYTIPAYWECKVCGQRKTSNGGWCPVVPMGIDIYDASGNYVGQCNMKEYNINNYCFQNNVTPKYYSHYDARCKYAPSDDPIEPDDPEESKYRLVDDKVYDENGKLVTGPNIVHVEINKGSVIQCLDVFVDANGNILKDNYLVFGNILYFAADDGSLWKKGNLTVITYDKYLYYADYSGNATLLKNETITIDGVTYKSDANGFVKQYNGDKGKPADNSDPVTPNDPSNNKNGLYKNEYVNGIWYGADGKADKVYNNGHWCSDGSGYWYEDNGYYPTSSWLKIDGKYYYFCADGYMDYSEYREGCWLNADGSWNESYSGGHWNEWSPGSGWWWYTDNTGYYPNSGSCWIDGHQYQFDADGWTYSK